MTASDAVPAKPRVFIGSSSEGLNIAEYLQSLLEGHAESTVWSQGVFGLSGGTLESLAKSAEDCDFAILVLTPDDITIKRANRAPAARDNVLFELGLFVGKLGRERTFIVTTRDNAPLLPTDLAGVTIAKFPNRADGNLKAALNPTALDIREAINKLGCRNRSTVQSTKESKVPSVFACSDSPEFVACVKDLLRNARRVVLMGTGLNILHHDPIRNALMGKAAAKQCQLEICLADPASPSVESRLIEEERGRMKPPVGRLGLVHRLDSLLNEWRRLGRPPSISIRLFGHYPTFALLIVDAHYFAYPYGYATLGNFSPVFAFSANSLEDRDVVEFLDDQYARINFAAVEADKVFQIREHGLIDPETLHPFALYFVPPQDSDFYEFGSRVLGYDVRRRKSSETRWERGVGNARDFGFHLTCADVLYFLNPEQVQMAIEEIAFLSKELEPFELQNLHLEAGFPDANSISVVINDASGTLEALHAELVQRVYRRSVASDYTMQRGKENRDQDYQRARLMVKRYKAPYILQHYRPHFTLLTNITTQEQQSTLKQIQMLFDEAVHERSIRIERLSVMTKPFFDEPWQIEREIKLGSAL